MREIAEGVWCAETLQPIPGTVLPLRMTIVRSRSGALWLHSPIAVDDALAAEIEQLGPVRHLVAPSLMHHLHLGAAAARWPEATRYGPPGLAEKRRDLGPLASLGDAPGWPEELSVLAIDGVPTFGERVFFHQPSRSLLVTDLLFNITRADHWLQPFVLRMTGTWGRLASSRAWGWTAKDRTALRSSLDRLLAWDFDRLIPCHGEVIDHDAHRRVTEALVRYRS